jgi:hypothetical protein
MHIRAITRPLAFLLAIRLACGPLTAQQAVNLSVAPPVTVSTFTQVVANVSTTQVISPGTVDLSNVSIKPVPTMMPITVGSFSGKNGSCAPAIPANAIIQDCTLGNTSFESDMVNLWLAVHGLPASEASMIYQYGGLDLRSDLRSFMFAYIEGVIEEDASLRTPSDQAVYNWIQSAVEANEITYYTTATQEYNRWFTSPCTFTLNPTVAATEGLSYDGNGYCGASLGAVFTDLPAPDVSYFREVGQLAGFDNQVSAYDVPNAAVNGAKIMLQAEQNNGKWASLAAFGDAIAAGTAAGAIVNGNINSIAPFVNRRRLNAQEDPVEAETEQAVEDGAEEAAESTTEEVETGLEIGTAGADVIGAATIVAIFIEIGVQAAINLSQTQDNQSAINALIQYGQTTAHQPPDLNAMLQDLVGYQDIFETFLAATLPDAISTAAPPALPPPPSFTDPSTDVFYIIDHTNHATSVANTFNYTTWDPQYPAYAGNPPFAQFGTSITAFPFGLGFVQTVFQGAVSKTFFSPTIKYIDPNTGIRYIADLIDKGRFLVTKAPDDIGNHDFDCPADAVTGVTQTPGTLIPSLCKSFVMSTLELFAFDSAYQTLQIPQPPVFSTPNAASFSTAGSIDFMPLLDTTTQGLPCSIRATGTLPPGMAFQNNTMFVQFPGSTIPGSYPFNFVADCETIGLGTQFANYTFGTSMTTQTFTANVYQAPGASGQASPERSQVRAGSLQHPAASPTTGLQFVFPSGAVTLTQGRSTQISLVTNGGTGTTITAGANALPPGMTLADNGNGTAMIGGIPTGAPTGCSSACTITASSAGFASVDLTLNYTVASPVLPTIPATQSVAWNAGQSSNITIDGSAGSNGVATNVALTWSVVGTLPTWASFTDNGNNIASISGTPPVATVGQTIPLQLQYSYGGTPGFTSPTFTINVTVNPPVPVLLVSPSLLFQVGVAGSGTISSSTLSGEALSGSWQVNAPLPGGLMSTPSATSLVISGTPQNPGDLLIPIQFTDSAGTTTTRNVAMMITQSASLANFPSRMVLFTGVPANFVLPVTSGFPRNPAGSPGDGLPSTTGTNVALSGNYSTTNGFTVVSNGGALFFGGTPLATAIYPLTVSAQTALSTGPVGAQVSQPFTLYVQPAGDVNLDGAVNCADYDLVKAHYGAVFGQSNYLDLADPNRDGVVNILDLAFVQAHLPKGTVCH